MRGAIVFVAVFVILLLATLAYSDLPPGKSIYNLFNFPSTDYQPLGFPVPTLISAIFNGVIYGIIAWLIYTVANAMTKKKTPVPTPTPLPTPQSSS
jgi:hypothetical protein